ncbi:MAG: 2,3-bisphosphoglycerate-independent phosphoglycerate mutase [Candidatus Buchananbacteria bacterium CG10_big_fil_rev_8_21_14_0_10_42_9]|uniref:2,3-bisphosphoglycerate-independent phosphoglycerate mutase n=1 Tax=Candidatus Buchananbacteria bacterium CG10_big_fil_rev_8_21_14_0_10_42_9 TaxID=1974526 RepID=A0A2H0W2J9_9BACT|nr:MAG: 2,3-bisphosphoglycerate-independent phosphoglycerate mutase [Candidatus Buchananbacteria bacterium CG10_big_fil_rev_8_21_14_0_10_42_9]
MAKQRLVMLISLDGWGVAPPSRGNAIALAKTPVMDHLVTNYPTLTIQASGESVGLSWGEMGNSEVGHLNLGSGKIIYQILPRINKSIIDGDFFQNKAILEALNKVKASNSTLHLMGLLSNGGVHSHQSHLYAILDLCQQLQINNVVIHVILDGRDTKRDGGLDFVKKLKAKLDELGFGKIATLSGRYYSMDRNNNWDRTALAYNAIAFGQSESNFDDPITAIEQSYKQEIYDEQLKPTVISQNATPVKPEDALIFFNYRADRARQITKAFILPDFKEFKRPNFLRGLFFVSMTEYESGLPCKVAFPPELIKTPLAKVLADAGVGQLHAAETEKYAHVTYFFNGGNEKEYNGETRLLVPSPSVPTYDEKPEMSAFELTEKVLRAVNEQKYKFTVVNFANPDMVAHTGNLKASIQAVEAVDKAIGVIVKYYLSINGVVFITADHGNAEELINLQTGEIDKEHSTNPVPFIIVGNEYKGQAAQFGQKVSDRDLSLLTPAGMLADVAPTILKVMDIPKPMEMTGTPLI